MLTSHDMSIVLGRLMTALEDALANMRQKEPQLVANLVYHIPKQLNKLPKLGRYTIKAGGVFVHQVPYIRSEDFPNDGSVELGDLLVIKTAYDGSQLKERRALLLQAKKTQVCQVDQSHNQAYLYKNWPQFEYKGPGNILKGKVRKISDQDVQSKDIYIGAKYLLLGLNTQNIRCACTICGDYVPCGCRDALEHWGSLLSSVSMHQTTSPTNPLSQPQYFVAELLEFIIGDGGKLFVKPMDDDIGWNRIIYDLLDDIAHRSSRWMDRAASSGGVTRGQGDLYLNLIKTTGLVSENLLSLFNISNGEEFILDGPPEIPDEPNIDYNDEFGGISIIEIVVHKESAD